LLTLEYDSSIRQNLLVAWADSDLLQNTCRVFKQLHDNQTLARMFEVLKEDKLVPKMDANLNAKCQLIRLIGILVFENRKNQNLVASNGIMEMIANFNLSMDVKNPFIREWSIIAMKHILNANDLK